MITLGSEAARAEPSQAAKALPQDPEPTQVIDDRGFIGMATIAGIVWLGQLGLAIYMEFAQSILVLGKDQSSDCVFSLQFEVPDYYCDANSN
ncbi:hypothetical protein Tco_0005035 [Tanacetum coccineum]